LDHELFDTFMQTNVRGPLKITEAFHEHVKASDQKRMIIVSSMAGSFGGGAASWPGSIYYKTSKAALNMAMANVATATKTDGIIVACLNPGTVQVEKLKEFDIPGMVQPEDSISNMIGLIEGLKLEQSGSFFQHTGESLPW
jgi:NAD(P)-dependent dehydrogenase (short-subunit alcohol dehydrogenase family)